MTFVQDKDKTKSAKPQFESNDTISAPFPGTSFKDFQNYKATIPGVQNFGVRTKPHKGVDYGSGLTYVDSQGQTKKVGLGTPVQAMMSGEATLMTGYYTSNKGKPNEVTDYGIAIRSKDPNGRDVTVVYGHLSKTSVENALGKDKVQQAIANSGGSGLVSLGRIERGQTIGAIGSTSYGPRTGNEPHVHISVYSGDTPAIKNFKDSRVINPTKYFNQFTPAEDKQKSDSGKVDTEAVKSPTALTGGTDDAAKKAEEAKKQSSGTVNSSTDLAFTGSFVESPPCGIDSSRNTAFVGSVTLSSDTAFVGSIDPSSGTAFTGPVANNTVLRVSLDTALRGSISQEPQQTQQSGMALGQ